MRLNQEPKEKAIESLTWIKEKLVISDDYKEALDMAIEALQAETKTGEWIRWFVEIQDETGVLYIPHAKCSNCGNEQDPYATRVINFCPICGRYMAKENEE